MFLVKTLPLIETFKIFNKEKQKEYLKLWDKQKEILFLMHNVRNIILLKPRQFGISILTGGDSLLQCAIQKGFVFLCISINGPDAEEYLDKAYKMWLTLPEWFRASHPIVSKTDNEIEFEFESRFVALPANRGSGFTADRVMIDEFFKINRTRSKITIEEVLSNVDSTLDKMEGQLFLCGTADGFNTQRDMYLESKKANSEREAIFISCWDDPNLTPEIREQKAKKLKKKVNQEYPRTDREAFLSSGSPRFNLDTIVNFYEQRTIECKVKGNINNEHRIEINEDGFISFYFKKKVRGQYLISADVAEGLEKGDYSCAKVFDLEDWNQCAEWHGHIEHAEFGTEVYKMATHWNNAIVAIEANNHGHTSIERLKTTHKYPVSLIHQSKISKEKFEDKFINPERRLGWYTTSTSKKAIINYLAQSIEDKESVYFSAKDIDELYSYMKESNGATNANIGQFDDRVMTYAIGWYLLRYYNAKVYKDWQKCEECHYYKKGFCTRTLGLMNKDSACLLFRQKEYGKSLFEL